MITLLENSNICDVTEGVILQGVNCQGVMGSGVAKQLRALYPDIFTKYSNLCKGHSFKASELLGYVSYYSPTPDLKVVIANCFTQEFYGKDGKKYASYDALEKCLVDVADIAGKALNIHIPYLIGAGLGGLKESIVLAMIEEVLSEQTVYLHKFNK